MLISQGSSLGFDVAGVADTIGNSVVLSAGFDVVNGSANTAVAPKGTGGAGAFVVNSTVTSSLNIAASSTAQIEANNAGSTSLMSDVSIKSSTLADLVARTGGTLTAVGKVALTALDPGAFAVDGASVTAGRATIFVDNSTINLTGPSVVLDASATGGASHTAGLNAGNGTGGVASIDVRNGGRLTVSGSVTGSADGRGGLGLVAGTAGGNGRGGNATISGSDGKASLTFNSPVGMSANGFGGSGNCVSCLSEAGTGTGGSVLVIAQQGTTTPGGGSSLNFNDPRGVSRALSLSADGFGGRGFNTNAGNGTGGLMQLVVDNGNAIKVNGSFSGDAEGFGGSENGTRRVGGIGTGGQAQVILHTGGTLHALNQFTIATEGFGGDGNFIEGGTGSSGGAGIGGTSRIYSDGGNGIFDMGPKA